MRIWDIPAGRLCRNHLLAEHRELHAIWSVIVNGKSGYSRHPEVTRWRGRLGALWLRHEEQKQEMLRRGYAHRSPLCFDGVHEEPYSRLRHPCIETVEEQIRKLREKGCGCDTETDDGCGCDD